MKMLATVLSLVFAAQAVAGPNERLFMEIERAVTAAGLLGDG